MCDKMHHTRPQKPTIAALSGAAPSALPTRDTSMIWTIVAVVCIGSFMGQLDASITQLVLPALEREFLASVGEVSWVALIFLLAVTVMLPVFGRLADMFGRKKQYAAGFLLFIAGCHSACNIDPLSRGIGVQN